jgi:hypothetical protein
VLLSFKTMVSVRFLRSNEVSRTDLIQTRTENGLSKQVRLSRTAGIASKANVANGTARKRAPCGLLFGPQVNALSATHR